MTDQNTTTTLSINVEKPTILGLEHLLQQGFRINTRVGITIQEFLEKHMGIPPDYISQRISTIFLDSKPVDDIKTAILRHGSSLALSGAMPGLVGALMRQNSILASLRSTITHQESGEDRQLRNGTFKIKLFNLLLKELGPRFLESGILLDSADLLNHLENHCDEPENNISQILLNRKPVDSLSTLIKILKDIISTSPDRKTSPGDGLVLFSVIPAQAI